MIHSQFEDVYGSKVYFREHLPLQRYFDVWTKLVWRGAQDDSRCILVIVTSQISPT